MEADEDNLEPELLLPGNGNQLIAQRTVNNRCQTNVFHENTCRGSKLKPLLHSVAYMVFVYMVFLAIWSTVGWSRTERDFIHKIFFLL